MDESAESVATEVLQRRPRPGGSGCERGVDGLEKNPNLEVVIRGVWASLVSVCLGMEVQNALLQPVIVREESESREKLKNKLRR